MILKKPTSTYTENYANVLAVYPLNKKPLVVLLFLKVDKSC